MVVLVTGANGQLGQSLRFIEGNHPDIQFVFCSSSDLDITNLNNIKQVFEQFKPNYCINAAAYTAVDKAESEPEKAHLINVDGAKNLAEVCKQTNCILLHISTDFVFDGTKKTPYTEEDQPNPTGVYGQTKLDGEKAIQAIFDNYYIIRTSWVYSQFGNNFMKTMLRLASERDALSVVNDQVGTPTHAVDLAECLVTIIGQNERVILSADEGQQPTTHNFGIYNFSNEGQCSWYDFAKEIFRVNNISINLQPIPTTSYPTPAQRPSYSVLDKSKIKSVFGVKIEQWKESLVKTISNEFI
ncbi:dTDP-4-dehydrorhamnose reductase [Flavobacterium sp.]|jgi:dTDP-4-dehydrorhamnose reductase|uniref:dTDP-4-dehydrorhamnose reductase n=1 Tax=Flavobacterium sp. TaxID=239 RepID=UPI0022CA7714|nr:dTDP-4-dehydrorhamnose reductase [Flavobacterium sp.]MCZ8144473.1 dTDP-4-dehydrorhamnose reductase [Flavobacterium sp.]MCZ8365851.1 dTDP-4-dehydrorhamnose reductase [Flavobacterium sp.]